MNYGLYLSASGMATNLYRQDVFANNLANAKTVGFKLDSPSIKQRDPEAIESGQGLDVSNRLLDILGGGALAAPQRVDFSQGQIEHTGNPFDFALASPDSFFNIQTVDSQGNIKPMLTRDGRFSRDSEGYLVTVTNGQKVLDSKDKPIVVPGDRPFAINESGEIYSNNEQVATLGISTVADKDKLIKHGQNQFTWREQGDLRIAPKYVSIRQSHVETSAVDPIQALMKLVDATKSANGNANLIRYHDQIMEQAVNTLGRVA